MNTARDLASEWPILSTLIFMPLVGALIALAARGDDHAARRNIRAMALLVSSATFLLALVAWSLFDPDNPQFQLVEERQWLPWFGGDIAYRVGVDGISLALILLTAFLTPFALLSAATEERRAKEYMIAFLVLETLMLGVFASLDLALFYLFFEGSLLPMFVIVGVWGGEKRLYAAFKFFLYTMLGSVLMLVAVVAMYLEAETANIALLLERGFSTELQRWAWLAFFASFAVKLPMWPVHTWLPDAHVEAPTPGSVILAAVLLKMGGYGFLRFSIPMFPEASNEFAPIVFVLSAVAVVYASLVAFAQDDMKKLIAYSSVAHMGFVTIGIFSLTPAGVQGGVFQMISHGLVSAALFLCVGVVYERAQTRRIDHFGGLANRMPLFAALFMVFTLANVGLPGTSGFVGEFLALVGAWSRSPILAAAAAIGMILSAVYALRLYRDVIFGEPNQNDKGVKVSIADAMTDLKTRDIALLAPLAILVILFGVHPAPILKLSETASNRIVALHAQGLERARNERIDSTQGVARRVARIVADARDEP